MALSRRSAWAGRLSLLPPTATLLGLAALWLAEHTLTHGAHRLALGWACGLLGGGLAAALLRLLVAPKPRRRAYALVLRCYIRQAWALGLYAACRGKLTAPLGELNQLLQVVWPAWLLRGLLPACAVEHALAGMRHAPVLEMGRLRLAARSAELVWLAGVSFAAFNYAGTLLAKKVDLSYLQATVPDSATQAVVQGLQDPVEVVAFFPPGNAVGERVRLYFAELEQSSTKLHVTLVDHALAGALAHGLDVRSNGTVALRGPRRMEQFALPLELGKARAALRRLDGDMLARLLAVSAPPRRAYVTYGHEEAELGLSGTPQAAALTALKRRLEGEGYVLRRLGPTEGLGRAVPADADLLVVLGPQQAFGAGETNALRKYLAGGGRLLLGLDPRAPRAKDSLAPVLAQLGVALDFRPLSNRQYQLALARGGNSSYNLLTTEVAQHPATAGLRRRQNKLGVLLPMSGTVSQAADAAATLQHTALLYTMPGTARQADWEAPPEPLHATRLPLALAVRQPATGATQANQTAPATQDMQAIVVASGAFADDEAMDNPGNVAFVRDACRWLTGDALLGTDTLSLEDAPLIHRQQDDMLWFYGTTFALPATVLALAAYVRGRGRARRPELAGRRSEVPR